MIIKLHQWQGLPPLDPAKGVLQAGCSRRLDPVDLTDQVVIIRVQVATREANTLVFPMIGVVGAVKRQAICLRNLLYEVQINVKLFSCHSIRHT